jgi:hypothetical protein
MYNRRMPPAYLSLAEVERIAGLNDPVVRNLQITQCYHELALAFAALTGGEANWCSFAAWASRQAGQTIRNEDLRRALEQALGSEAIVQAAAERLAAAARRLGARFSAAQIIRLALQALRPEQAFARSSEAVGRGNQKVFAEIGREFARFYAACLTADFQPPAQPDPAAIAGFCGLLRSGDPPDGQRYLRQAFQRYYQALFMEAGKARSELLLLANIEIGFHEQTRLQPEINAALSAPVIAPDEFTRNLLAALIPADSWLAALTWRILRFLGQLQPVEAAIGEVYAAAQRQAQRLVTEAMMSLELPAAAPGGRRRLRLGEDLPLRFPPELAAIANPELQALLAQIDPTPDSIRQTAAEHWGDLPDRLHFIADLFRACQRSPTLHEPPFDPAQAAALKDGRMPSGRL